MSKRWAPYATALLILALPAAANSQTRSQCEAIAAAMPPVISSAGEAHKQLSALDWTVVSRASSGQFKAASDAARVAQDELLAAFKRYVASIQDVTYQAQLCAR